ncbi:chorismate synthase [Salsipaludibacter albus]|uniref:chorismate synthase n=1 Tax=Salsipaludibacter albus TaxID=2849650 RepID=UPI001EE4E54A|nr:chorismate synthase [Salsipaludibacter albus]MBY5164048.1 chorismate synthase [Salsipaludibacter albus]
MRYLTAGESHGPALVATVEGLPAGLELERQQFDHELFRRRLGHGRSPRMDFEVDRLEFLGGLRHGRTLGTPLAVVIHNTEWPKWVDAMDPLARDDLDEVRDTGRGRRLTRPRPGHADLVGALKYGYDDVRDALERASARETAARTVVGTACKALLAEVGVTVVSHVTNIGGVTLPDDAPRPGPDDLAAVDASPVRTLHGPTAEAMVARIDAAHADNDTLGGVMEVIAHGLPPGLGSHVHRDRTIDARLAAAAVGVQAMKGVEFGLGFAVADTPGSAAHDEIGHDGARFTRATNRSGGIEAGMTTGEPLVMRVAMKPLSSLPRPLATAELDTHEDAVAITQRSDACAVPRAGVVLEHVVAFELAAALLEKTGGDTVDEVVRNLAAYRDAIADR